MRLIRLSGQALAAALILFCFPACDNSKIEVYRVEKEQDSQSVRMPEPSGGATGGGNVTWQAPADWEEQPSSGPRRGTFKIHGQNGGEAELSITAFPGDVGGLLANINRWRGQIQLPPLTEPDLAQVATPIPGPSGNMLFVDIVSADSIKGAKRSRILGGILPLDAETWFFKLSGPDEIVAARKDEFKKFLETVKTEAPPLLASSAEKSGSKTNAPTPPVLATTTAQPDYKTPPGWTAQPLSPMRLASFKITGSNGAEADVSVVSLAGMAGGDLANINRWRDQLKLPPLSERDLASVSSHVNMNGHDFLVTDLVSAEPIPPLNRKVRIVAAAAREGEQTWFVKMTGDVDLVGAQKNHFLDFLRSLSLAGATGRDESSAQ
jgi:hypothetical protein